MSDEQRARLAELEAFAAELWQIVMRKTPTATPTVQLQMLLGASQALVHTHERYIRTASVVEVMRAQVNSMALAGLSERVKVLGEPLIDTVERPPAGPNEN